MGSVGLGLALRPPHFTEIKAPRWNAAMDQWHTLVRKKDLPSSVTATASGEILATETRIPLSASVLARSLDAKVRNTGS